MVTEDMSRLVQLCFRHPISLPTSSMCYAALRLPIELVVLLTSFVHFNPTKSIHEMLTSYLYTSGRIVITLITLLLR
jgi:hypothetical protein